jgi:hypothetical protein
VPEGSFVSGIDTGGTGGDGMIGFVAFISVLPGGGWIVGGLCGVTTERISSPPLPRLVSTRAG